MEVCYKFALAIKSPRRAFVPSWAIFEGVEIEVSKQMGAGSDVHDADCSFRSDFSGRGENREQELCEVVVA
jgi:hypothetical protein